MHRSGGGWECSRWHGYDSAALIGGGAAAGGGVKVRMGAALGWIGRKGREGGLVAIS